jgi:hypothetical protein
MPEGNLVDCPACGELVSAGALCEECGAELPEPAVSKQALKDGDVTRPPFAFQETVEEPSPLDVDQHDLADVEEAKQALKDGKVTRPPFAFQETVEEPSPPDVDQHDLADVEEAKQVLQNMKIEAPEVEVKPALVPTHEFVATDQKEDEALSNITDDCPHFRLEFNDARVFVKDWTASFNFRITPTSVDSRQCRLPQLEVRIQGSDVLKQTIWGLNRGGAQEVDVNFSPNYLGFEIASEVHLSYQLNGKSHSYVSRFKWDCVRPEESSKVIENLVIKMENVEAGMAADQNINILKDFKAKQSHSLSSRLQDLKLKPIWKRLELFDITEGTAPVPKDLVGRLTLRGPGEVRLHLLGGNRFSMGNNVPTLVDIVTALFTAPDTPDISFTRRNGVSRFQAHIVYRNNEWEVRDGGIDPTASLSRVKPSTIGTFVNGKKVDRAVSLSHSNSDLTFGRPDKRSRNTFGFEVDIAHDPQTGKRSALLLERTDSVRESFLLLAGTVDLGEILPGIGTGEIRYRKGGFKFVSNTREFWLKPGVTLDSSWACEGYEQIGSENLVEAKKKYAKPPSGWRGRG